MNSWLKETTFIYLLTQCSNIEKIIIKYSLNPSSNCVNCKMYLQIRNMRWFTVCKWKEVFEKSIHYGFSKIQYTNRKNIIQYELILKIELFFQICQNEVFIYFFPTIKPYKYIMYKKIYISSNHKHLKIWNFNLGSFQTF